MSSNRIVVFSTLYVVGIGAYAYSVSNFALYEIFPRFVLVLLPILVLCWPVVLLKKNSPRGNVDKKTQGFLKDLEEEAKTEEKLYKKIKNQKKTAQIKIDNRDINEPGLMDKVKRLKSLYNNGTLTKDEFEKAKNKLLK
tara:strand:- start:428 stop:844 length:417 start_codon:yes stop_codon:yes gene_type:complete